MTLTRRIQPPFPTPAVLQKGNPLGLYVYFYQGVCLLRGIRCQGYIKLLPLQPISSKIKIKKIEIRTERLNSKLFLSVETFNESLEANFYTLEANGDFQLSFRKTIWDVQIIPTD